MQQRRTRIAPDELHSMTDEPCPPIRQRPREMTGSRLEPPCVRFGVPLLTPRKATHLPLLQSGCPVRQRYKPRKRRRRRRRVSRRREMSDLQQMHRRRFRARSAACLLRQRSHSERSRIPVSAQPPRLPEGLGPALRSPLGWTETDLRLGRRTTRNLVPPLRCLQCRTASSALYPASAPPTERAAVAPRAIPMTETSFSSTREPQVSSPVTLSMAR